jgi:hypothetical protein
MRGSVAYSRDIIRRAIYQLKYRFGYPVDFYKIVKGAYNTQTGKYSFVTAKTTITRAVIMPSAVQRNFFFSISVIQANSRFIQGGDIEINDRQIIIDGRDLPKGPHGTTWIIDVDDYFIFENQRYDIKVAQALEYNTGWIISGRQIEGATNGEIHEHSFHDYVVPFDSFGIDIGVD